MDKVAFVFPGQGAQYVGMGKDLYDHYSEARELYEKANQILGINIRDISFEGPENELTKSKNAQVAILLHSIACFKLMEKENYKPSVVAGHSLGEYSALFAANAIELDDVLHLVRFRGELMSRAGEINPGRMTAVIGIEASQIGEVVREVSKEGIISVANYNSPLQTVISGEPESIEKVSEILKNSGAKRVIPLRVSGAFHSPLMKEAFSKFEKVLLKIEIKSPVIPVVPNVTGKLTTSPLDIKEALKNQIISPVRWVDSIENMIKFGVNTFIELGPGKVLSGLIRKINPEVKVIKPDFI
ncbi:ACP S-malonyltransferase [candidate division WOR-3 bacterium]|nr:ACP S-malonyltransferase [candidate division WOR-3 bacterium]